MRGSRKFCQMGPNSNIIFSLPFFFFFFWGGGGSVFCFLLVDDGREDQNTTKSGSLSNRERNAIEMAFCWRTDDAPTLNAGLVDLFFSRGSGPVLLGNPIVL